MPRKATVNSASLDSAPTKDPMISLVNRVETCPRNVNIELNSNNNTMLARLTITNTELREDEGDNNNENEDEDEAAAMLVTEIFDAVYSSVEVLPFLKPGDAGMIFVLLYGCVV
jgi:hypothetical protein